jgi:O-antigen/teichoic acid export membrane protein
VSETIRNTAGASGAQARRAARNAGAIALAQIASKGALFLWQLVLIPLLGPQGAGVYSLVAALFLVGVTITAFGMGSIVIREAARHPDRAGRYLGATLFTQTILAMLAYIGINAAAALLGYALEVRVFVALAGLSLFIDQLGTMAYEQLLAQERMVTTSLVEVGTMFGRIALAGLLLWLGFGLFGVYAAGLAAGLVRAVILWRQIVRGGLRPQFPLDRGLTRRLLLDAAPLAAAAVVNQGYAQLDKLVTGSLIGETGAGYLNAAFIIVVGMVELLSTTILIAVYPMMSRLYGEAEDRAVFRMMVDKLAFFTLLIALPITLGVSIFADAIIGLIFRAAFAPSADVLRLLVWYALLTIIANVYAQALLVQNRQRITLGIRVLGLGVNLTLLLVLLPAFGIIGAPIASMSAELVALALLAYAFLAGGRVLPHHRGIVRVIAAGLLAAIAMLIVGQVHFIVGGLVGLIAYAIAAWRLGALADDDRQLLAQLIAAMPGGDHLGRWLGWAA